MNFLLDENTDPAIGIGIRRSRPEIAVWHVGGERCPAYGTLDPNILLWCESHDCALITNNRSTMPVHLTDHLSAGHHVPGIFVIRHDASIGEVVSDLTLIWVAAREAEFDDQIVYLPL